MTSASVIADLGSGTGISSELFLKLGCAVHGIEPNREMRIAGEALLKDYPLFTSIDATAEQTGLNDSTADFVVAGQAFHWFDFDRARIEFARILKDNGWVVLLWNSRRTDPSEFLREYEQLLLKFGTDYTLINHTNFDAARIEPFFRMGTYHFASFDNFQKVDYDGLEGRLMSSSYVPNVGDANHQPMIENLKQLFAKHQVNETVTIEYDTQLYYGHL